MLSEHIRDLVKTSAYSGEYYSKVHASTLGRRGASISAGMLDVDLDPLGLGSMAGNEDLLAASTIDLQLLSLE
jgi:hypothetical protein